MKYLACHRNGRTQATAAPTFKQDPLRKNALHSGAAALRQGGLVLFSTVELPLRTAAQFQDHAVVPQECLTVCHRNIREPEAPKVLVEPPLIHLRECARSLIQHRELGALQETT